MRFSLDQKKQIISDIEDMMSVSLPNGWSLDIDIVPFLDGDVKFTNFVENKVGKITILAIKYPESLYKYMEEIVGWIDRSFREVHCKHCGSIRLIDEFIGVSTEERKQIEKKLLKGFNAYKCEVCNNNYTFSWTTSK